MADDLDKENQETDFTFGDDNEDDSEGFGGFNNEQSLGNAIQSNVALKIGIIAAAVVFIIGGFMLFGTSSSDNSEDSSVGTGGTTVSEAPTTEEVTPSYKEAIDEFNETGEEDAAQTGDSFIPVPTGPATNTGIVVPEEEDVEEDPLERWRLLQEERAQQQRQQLSEAQEQRTPGELSPEEQRRQEAVETLAQNMVASMQELSTAGPEIRMNAENIIGDSEEFFEARLDEAQDRELASIDRRIELIERREELEEVDPSAGETDVVPANVLIPEGTIEYAQMLIQANSDIPGPVLAQLVSGPLAGSRLIGSFSVEDKYLVMEFSRVVVDGVGIDIEAVAVDPNSNLTGVATEVDNRYFKRLILPVAAEFITGFADALADTQESTFVTGEVIVTQDNDLDTDEAVAEAISESGEVLSDFVQEEADRTEILVKVAAGTPIGVLFAEPVLDCPITLTCDTDSNN